jgi:hypothetical protein
MHMHTDLHFGRLPTIFLLILIGFTACGATGNAASSNTTTAGEGTSSMPVQVYVQRYAVQFVIQPPVEDLLLYTQHPYTLQVDHDSASAAYTLAQDKAYLSQPMFSDELQVEPLPGVVLYTLCCHFTAWLTISTYLFAPVAQVVPAKEGEHALKTFLRSVGVPDDPAHVSRGSACSNS